VAPKTTSLGRLGTARIVTRGVAGPVTGRPVGSTAIIPRQRQPGEEVWRLRHGDRVQSCELRNDSKAGAGWDVMVLKDGEPLFSRRCADERGARFVAESFRQNLLRTGWLPVSALDN
jgi:hypothetical protein